MSKAILLAVSLALVAGSCQAAEPWNLEGYQRCDNVSLGRDDLVGVAYGANDGLVWAISSKNETVVRGYDLSGSMRRYLRSREHKHLKGISWLHGDTLALTLPGENRIAYANVGRASSRLALSYKSLVGDGSLKSPDKITYNSEARILMVTDVGNETFGPKKQRPSVSLVMLNGVVRPTTDENFDSAADLTDVYYATSPKKLFVLSNAEQELAEISGDGKVGARLSLKNYAKNPISFTFSPEGTKLIVLEADGSMHILSNEACSEKPQNVNKRAVYQEEQLARMGRKVLGAKPRDARKIISPIIDIAGERSDSWMDDLRKQVAKQFNRKNDIYLHYSRLPIKRNNYLGIYSVCEAHNLTQVAPDQEFSGLAFHDGRKTMWSAATSVNRLLEYSVNGELERGISIGKTTDGALQGPLEITPTVNGDHFAVMTVNKQVYSIELSRQKGSEKVVPKISQLKLQMPPMYNQTKLVGLTWDDETGRFFLAQSQPPAVWSLAEDTEPVLLFGSEDLPIQDISGLAHNRHSNTLLLASSVSHAVLETSMTGEILDTMGLSGPVSEGLTGMEVAGSGKVMFLVTRAGVMHIFSAVKC